MTPTLIQGNLHIRSHVTHRNASLLVNGSVFLEAGGTLELHDSSLSVLCTYDRQFNYTWRGGRLLSSSSTVGGRLGPSGLCTHTNLFLYDGAWDSSDDAVQCSYGVLFSESSVGRLRATRLRAGVSPDSIIMGGRGNVSLVDSTFPPTSGSPS